MKKILLILIALIAPIHAANITWLGTSASAKTAANWVGGVLPAEGDVWVLSSTNSNAMTVDSNFTNAGISADAGYTATVSLQTYTIRTTGNVSLGGTVLSAGTSTLKAIGTSGTQAITSAGETWYDIIDSTIGASFSTSDNLSCHTFTKLSTSTGAPTFAGDSVYVSGDFSLDGASSPVVTMGTALRAGGASSRVHWGSGLGTVSAGSMQLYMSTSTAGVIDLDKAHNLLQVVLGSSAVVTNSGATALGILGTSNLLTLGAGASLTITTPINFNLSGSSAFMVLGSGATFSGAGTLTFSSFTTGTGSIPAFTHAGSVSIINSTNGATVNLAGNISISGVLTIGNNQASSTWTLNFVSYNVSCGTLQGIGSNQSTATCNVNFGSGSFSCSSFNSNYNSGTSNINFGTSSFSCSGSWTFGSNHTVDPGTSLITFSGTAAHTITSNGKLFYDVTINNTATAGTTFADAPSLHTLTVSATNTQAVTWVGFVLTASGNVTIDGSGTLNCGNGITASGASSNVHFGSTLGTVTATSCVLTMNTSTSGVIDDDKGITFLSYTQGASAIVTNSGSATSTYTTTGTPITFTNSGNLTLTTSIICNTTGSVPLIAIAGTPTISGAGVLTIRSNGNGTTATIPAMNLGCTTIFTSNAGTSKTITFVGNLISTATSIAFRTEASAIVYNTGGYSITTNDLYIGSNSSAGTFTFNCGASDISITSLNNTYNTGSTTFDWGTSKISCSGPLNFGSTWAMTIGSAIFRYTGTGAATWTTNGKRIYDFRNVGSATAKLTLGDSLRCAYYYDSSGKFNQNGKTIYVDSNYTNVSPDSAQMSADIKIGKNYYRGTPTLVVRTAGSLHLDTSVNYKHLFTANGNQIGPLIAKRVAFQDSAKLQKLTAPDSSVFALKDGVGLRCDTLDTANFNGRSGKLNYWTADAPTAILWLPNALTASYVYGSNIEAKGYTITANNGNNVNGGGTVNWIWPTVSRNNIKKRFRFGLGFGF